MDENIECETRFIQTKFENQAKYFENVYTTDYNMRPTVTYCKGLLLHTVNK